MNTKSLNDVVRNKVLCHLKDKALIGHAEYHIFNQIFGVEEGIFEVTLITGEQLHLVHEYLFGLGVGLVCCDAMDAEDAGLLLQSWMSVVTDDLPDMRQKVM